LTAFAAVLLGWLSAHTDILFADGLRYVVQAQRIDRGDLVDGLLKSVDHPAYPLAIVAAHRFIGGTSPVAWQDAAQLAAVVAGVLLVLPLYLVALELFGPRAAWMGVLLVYVVPLNAHVMADALSESTFLLFWTWGLWASLKFLKEGTFGWLPLMIACGVLAYASRPEGLLLPGAVVATLAAMPLLRLTRLYWPRWVAAVTFLVVGPALLAGPYVALKGGLGTKPAVARILGTAPHSAPDAVERARPLDPTQTTAKTYAIAAKATFEAVRDAVSIPLLPLAILGVWACRPLAAKARVWLFLGIVFLASVLVLVRLHATGGYCTPRHAMILSLLLILASGLGLDRLLSRIAIPARWLGNEGSAFRAGPAVWGLSLAAYVVWAAPTLFAPINAGMGGYRAAGNYLAQHVPPGTKVVDVTGWSLFYGERPGYTFANLIEAPGDPNLRWVVARDAHLKGPWGYCQQLRALVAGLEPVATFPEKDGPSQARVYVYDRLARTAHMAGSDHTRRR
jgi:4-amino-4-deoxy-L-arabinose transferase-like glycosyltransferase